jgi:hypothetical protein
MRGRERVGAVWIAGLACCVAAAAAQSAEACGDGAPPRSSLTRLRDGAQPPVESAVPEGGAADLSGEGLTEVPGHTAAGGSTVNLGGRFRTAVGLRRPGASEPDESRAAPPSSGSAD